MAHTTRPPHQTVQIAEGPKVCHYPPRTGKELLPFSQKYMPTDASIKSTKIPKLQILQHLQKIQNMNYGTFTNYEIKMCFLISFRNVRFSSFQKFESILALFVFVYNKSLF